MSINDTNDFFFFFLKSYPQLPWRGCESRGCWCRTWCGHAKSETSHDLSTTYRNLLLQSYILFEFKQQVMFISRILLIISKHNTSLNLKATRTAPSKRYERFSATEGIKERETRTKLNSKHRPCERNAAASWEGTKKRSYAYYVTTGKILIDPAGDEKYIQH